MTFLRKAIEEIATLDKPERHQARTIFLLAGVSTALFAALCLAGIILNYSPIPHGDDWAGYIGFNLDVMQGKTSAWWAQDDAHRLFVPRLLVWLDFHLGAGFIFMITASMLMRLGILVTLIFYFREFFRGVELYALSALSCVLAFSWMQAPNFYHGWDGIISFSAILLAMLAFYWLQRSKEHSGWFIPALIAGFASIGTMANGLLVLPIMVVMSALIGLGIRRTLLIAAVAVASFVLYFWQFEYPQGSPPNLLFLAVSTLVFLGNPLHFVTYYWIGGLQQLAGFVFGDSTLLAASDYRSNSLLRVIRMVSVSTAAVAGMSLLATAAMITWRWLRRKRSDTRLAAPLAFIGFIGASAALTALGRTTYGLDYGLQARYTTATMVAWQLVAVLLLAGLDSRRVMKVAWILAVIIPIALLPIQLRSVLKPNVDRVAREESLKALRTGHSDNEVIDRQVKRLKEMGIKLAID